MNPQLAAIPGDLLPDFGLLNNEDLDVYVEPLPELTAQEEEARRRAVTMLEFDGPRPEEDWSSTSLDLPRLTEEEAEEARRMMEENMRIMEQDNIGADINERTVAPDDDDLHVTVAAPPVKPRIGSNVRIEETPDVGSEERPRRRSPQPGDIIQPFEMRVEEPSPDNSQEGVPPPVIQPPEIQDDQPSPAQVREAGDIPDQVPQTDQQVVDDPLELSDLHQSQQPKRKKRRLTRPIIVDGEPQIRGEVIKAQCVDYGDTLTSRAPIDPKLALYSLNTRDQPGRRLGTALGKSWKDAMVKPRGAETIYDWDDEAVQVHDQEEELAAALNTLDQDVSKMRDDDRSELREGDVSRLNNVPETSHLNVPKDTVNDQDAPPPPGNHSTAFDFIPEEVVEPEQENLDQQPQNNINDVEEPRAGDLSDPDYQLFNEGLHLSSSIINIDTGSVSSSRTVEVADTVQHVRDTLGSTRGSFKDLAPATMKRRDVAMMFFNLLVANKEEVIEMSQDGCYEDVSVVIL